MSKIRIRGAAALCVAMLMASTTTTASAEGNAAVRGSSNNSAVAAVAATQTRAVQADREICVRAEIANSHIARRICRSAENWERAGGLPTTED